jgi:hypothetical protein
MVDGAHHDESHQKQKLRQKKTTAMRESLLSKMASVHSTLAATPSKTAGQQLKPTLTSMFSSWMKVTLTMWH